ncbi:MAG: S46 family peptidase [Rhodothermales bacterium]|nr:S46 family peptidase [Rhodothermales bacterium]
MITGIEARGKSLLGLLLLSGTLLSAQAQPEQNDPLKAGRFDNGKMWTFDYPPADYFEEAYGFSPDEAWFDRARLGALRIPGCTASFVSSTGLVLTNHHCGRGPVAQVTQAGENLLDDGFYAPSLAEERIVPGFYADQMIAIADVTDEVFAAQQGMETDAERAAARDEAVQRIQDRLTTEAGGAEAGIVVEVTPLYHGGRYSAYTFRRYPDVRLVMAPELQMGFFGGDDDNFTFPRYALDMTFFRVYDDAGEPLETEHYFTWSLEGVQPGHPVFVIGNPGSTSRLETVAQLDLRRDVTDKSLLAFVSSRLAALERYQESLPPSQRSDATRNQIFSLRNAQKAYTGQQAALVDPVVVARKKDAERAFMEAIRADAALTATYGSVISEIAETQTSFRELGAEYGAFFGLTSAAYSSALMRRAIAAYTYLERRAAGQQGAALDPLETQINGIADQPEGLARELLATRLHDFLTYFGTEDTVVQTALAGASPEDRAAALLASSALATAEKTQQAMANETLTMEDPAVILVGAFIQRYRDFQSASAGLTGRQNELASQLGRARFAVYDTDVPPDATFSLRIADGVVAGYPYNGTFASPFTSFYGLYDHYYSYGAGSAWDLPARWLKPPATFDMGVPMNFASTNDIIGGNSGSPVLNQDLELVGLIFDGNIESLAGEFMYLPEKNRAVSVDARGILEALDEIYDADRIVLELTEDELVPTEDEADRSRGSQR